MDEHDTLARLRAAALERDWSILQDTLADALSEVEYFAGLEIGLTRAHDHLPVFEQHHPDASWARALLVWLASYGAPPADLPMDAGLAHDSPGANNFVAALVELARSAERKTPYENRIRFLANAIGNLIVADLAAYWYAENADMWAFQQEHGSEIDDETGEPISQIVYASFWLDEDVAARDTAAWIAIADQLERKMKG
ncbi:MAG: hypothetical protein GC179_17405 [Anaerolineaceae bacterium]|nr:hypothetical protein [Anaerolineaceae bacterium]